MPSAGLCPLPTGITGLDEVTKGGLVVGGVYLVCGAPGSGKTVMGNQIAHDHARRGEQVVFATILVEAHDRMAALLSNFSFFGHGGAAERVHYMSLYDAISENGLDGTIDALRRLVREYKATLLVIDGAGRLEDFAGSPLEFRRFTYELQIQLAALNCTCLLLSDQDARDLHPLEMQVDGIFLLVDENVGARSIRWLQVRKMRGRNFLRGRHAMDISDAGIAVYPRLEALRAEDPLAPDERRLRQAFGVSGLDQMLRGGVLSGSTTMILGAPGAGKTIASLHFVGTGLEAGQRALIVGFNETPAQLMAKGESVGVHLRGYLESGALRVIWHPPLEVLIDAWSHEVLAAVQEHRPARVVLDGLSDVEHQEVYPGRLPTLLAALANELSYRDITTLMTAENRALVGANLDVPLPAPSATVENVILLRYVELRSHLHRLISVLKVRESDHDTSIREFAITSHGIEVADTFESAEAVLTGVARYVAPLRDSGCNRGEKPQ